MIPSITLLLTSAITAPEFLGPVIAECAVGRAVLTDLSASIKGSDYLIDRDQIQSSSLFAICPDLLSSLPSNIRIASKAEIARVNDLSSPHPVTILTVSVPKISNSRRAAVVSYSYICNGLCGAGYRVRYKLTGGVWRGGKEKRLWVS